MALKTVLIAVQKNKSNYEIDPQHVKRAGDCPRQSSASQAANFTSAELHRRTVERRAVDAVIWALPLVSEDSVKQAAFRDGKASYNDIVCWPNIQSRD